MKESFRIKSSSANQTRQLGTCLSNLLAPGDILLLKGSFGAGKTTLVQGIANGLGIQGRVTSPSFALVNEYRADAKHGRMPIYHIDVYRVASPEEALQFGMEEYLSEDAVTLIEWAENIADALPEEHMRVELEVAGPTRRILEFTATGPRYEYLLQQFSQECGAKT